MSVVALAAGGTAGHINPALALAEELTDRGHTVRFYGTRRGMESKLVPEHGYNFEGLDVSGFDRSRPWTAITAQWSVAKAGSYLINQFTREGVPAAAVGFGAYVEVPLARAARSMGIPLVLHEQNSVPGMANKMLSKDARLVALTYPSTEEIFARASRGRARCVVCGNPVRREVLEPDRTRARASLGIPDDATLLVVFGGSLGARHINQTMVGLRDTLLGMEGLYVIQATGQQGYEETAAALFGDSGAPDRWRVLPYIDDMGSCLAAADAVCSRAGASSIAEIAARCVPSILVPYPFATENHQSINARLLVDAGGAVEFDDDAIEGEEFARSLVNLLSDERLRSKMRTALEGLGQAEAAARLADAVEDAMGGAANAPNGGVHV